MKRKHISVEQNTIIRYILLIVQIVNIRNAIFLQFIMLSMNIGGFIVVYIKRYVVRVFRILRSWYE